MNRGRPRQFDEKEALQKAMLVFWRNGYRGTSLDDLTRALNINRPSLYAAFGDKETLFLQVVDYYRDHMIAPAVSQLVGCDTLRHGLRAFFRAMANLMVENESPPGCLIACLLAEECCESDLIRAKLAGLIDATDRLFEKVFEDHREQLSPVLTPRTAGKLLACTIHGIAIRARAGASKRTIVEIGEAFVDSIGAS